MNSVFRQRLLASTLLVGAALAASPASAQNAETNIQDETADVGDPAARFCSENPDSPQCEAEGTAIVVTGSRIASPTLSSASPLQIVDAQDLDDSGVVNVQEVLQENPTFGAPVLSRGNSAFLTSGTGVATVNLRNLGSARTLVLVNGRRFVAGTPGTSFVDLNSIPTQFIERIDILTGGASSIYGSDAVAGVVNIIYKDDFEGLEASGQIGVSEHGDDVRKQANLLMGANFADGRGNVTAYLGYSDEGYVFSRNRDRTAVDQISCIFTTGDFPEDTLEACRPFFSSFAPQGSFNVRPARDLNGDGDFTDAGETSLTLTYDPVTGALVTPSTNGSATRNPTGFNRSAFRTIAVPVERYLMALRGNYEVSEDINAFFEGTFAQTKSAREIEPFALDTAGVGGVFQPLGRFNIERNVTLADGSVVTVRNPLVPDGLFNPSVDTDGDGLRDLSFTRRLTDVGPRAGTVDRTTFRVLAGLDGSVFGDWNWDVFYAYGETVESQVSTGQINVLTFREALEVVADVNDVDGDGNRSEAICEDAVARSQGCVPADVFSGANRISPEALAYISGVGTRNTSIEQKLAGANLTGNLFDLWDGPVGLAIGTEYRKETSEAINDPLTAGGFNGGNAIPSVSGSFDVVEGYGELVVPIFADRPFFETLNLRGAVRVSDYSTVGTTYSWNYGVEYAPIPDVRFRAVQARATRAPNISELFTPPSQTFPGGLEDPCEGVTAATPGTLGTVCRSFPGVNLNIAQNGGVFTLNQADLQGISGFNRGNPDLSEEKGDSLTIGVIVNPTSISWLRNFALTIDYFDIEIEDAIVPTGRQFILDQCFNEGNLAFCDFIQRRETQEGANSPGSLNFIDSAVTNSGGLSTEGIDVTLSYRQNLENWGLAGQFNARFSYTHTFEGDLAPLPGEPIDPFNRELGASRNKAFGTLGYNLGDWGLTLRGTYTGPAYIDDQFSGIQPGEEGSEFLKVGSEFVADMQFRFTPGDNYEFYFGVDNLFDNEPPLIPTQVPVSIRGTGTETDPSVYDAIGRRFYAGARLKF